VVKFVEVVLQMFTEQKHMCLNGTCGNLS